MSFQFTSGKFKAWDPLTNVPLSNGRLYTFASGTTTQKNAFTDYTLGTPCTYVSDGAGGLYIALDAAGEADVWMGTGAYTMRWHKSDGTLVDGTDGLQDPKGGVDTLRADLLDTASASKGPGLMALNPTLNYAVGTMGARLKTTISVKDYPYLATGDGTTDDAAAINDAIAAAGNGGHVHFPAGTYLAQSPILAENFRGLTITGESGQYGYSGTRIIGKHTGKSTLSMVGSFFCDVSGISIEGDTSSKPVTGLLLGRSSAASAGNHTFTNVHVQGYFQKCGLYNVASEENTFLNCYIVPTTATVAGLYMSQGDGSSIGGLTASSMETNTFIGGTIGNVDNTAGTTGLYIDCGAATGHHQFLGTFITKNGGDSFIYIRLGAMDGLDTTFPISFYNVIGEYNTDQPTTGLHFVSASSKILAGFTAKNIRFQTPATNNILCDGGGTVYLIGADISTPYGGAAKPSTFQSVEGSTLNLLSESAITINILRSSNLLHNTAGPTITTSDASVVRDISGSGFSLSESLGLGTGGTVSIGGTQVVGARKTGYNAMTGTIDRATVWDTSTITLAQLAQRVNALQYDLTNQHGLIGS